MVCSRGESLTLHINQMKLVHVIATAAVAIFLPLIPISPAVAETELDYKQKAVGFLAQAMCSQRLNNQSTEFVRMKVNKFVDAYPEASMHLYIQEPKAMRAASLLALGFNSNCSAPDMKSSDTRKAIALLDEL